MTGKTARAVSVGLVVLVATLGARPAAAQTAPKQDADPFESALFPPELIMQHGRAIRLNDEQRNAITQLIEQLQGRVIGLQWQLAEQVQTLKQTLASSRVDQDRALDQLNRVLDTEKRIKQAHLEMLIRIKNVLRRDQQAELARLRDVATQKHDEGREIQASRIGIQQNTGSSRSPGSSSRP